MAITINGSSVALAPKQKKRKQVHTQPQMPTFSLNESGHKVRVANFQYYLGYKSHSSFYEWRKQSKPMPERVPEPDGHDGHPYWWSETVKAYWAGLLERYRYSPRKLSKLNFY